MRRWQHADWRLNVKPKNIIKTTHYRLHISNSCSPPPLYTMHVCTQHSGKAPWSGDCGGSGSSYSFPWKWVRIVRSCTFCFTSLVECAATKETAWSLLQGLTQHSHLTHFHSCQTAPQIRHEMVLTRCMSLLTTWTQIEDLKKQKRFLFPELCSHCVLRSRAL